VRAENCIHVDVEIERLIEFIMPAAKKDTSRLSSGSAKLRIILETWEFQENCGGGKENDGLACVTYPRMIHSKLFQGYDLADPVRAITAKGSVGLRIPYRRFLANNNRRLLVRVVHLDAGRSNHRVCLWIHAFAHPIGRRS
jgi:hypothetical protein